MFHARCPRRRTAIAVLTVALATACAGSGPGGVAEDDPGDPGDPGDPRDGAAARVVDLPDDLEVPEGVDPESMVVVADLLTTGGDLEQAVAEGVATEADVTAARNGLADGTLAELFD